VTQPGQKLESGIPQVHTAIPIAPIATKVATQVPISPAPMIVAGAGAASSSRASSWGCCCTGDPNPDDADGFFDYSTMLDRVPLPPSSLVALVAPNVAAAGVVQRH
jgi:hypothetical protein